MNSNINQITDIFKKHMTFNGIICSQELVPDGALHRFNVSGRRADGNSGWYVLHADGIPNGVYGDWKSGSEYKWCARLSNELSEQERQQMQAQIEQSKAEREKKLIESRKQARQQANTKWKNAKLALKEHPYLKRKKILSYGIRNIGDDLVIPVMDISGEIHSLQLINAKGEKWFLSGGAKKGYFYT